MIEDLSSSFFGLSDFFLSLIIGRQLFESYGYFQASASGRLTIPSQFDAGSIIVRH
jgi:hypothetical protein